MKLPRRAAAGLIAAALLTPLTLLAPASPAAAAGTTCTVTPSSVTLYDKPKKVKFRVNSRLPFWMLDVPDAEISPTSDDPVRELDSSTQFSWIAGKVDAFALLSSADGYDKANCKTTFTILRGSRISLAAKTVTGRRQFTGSLKAITFGWHHDPSYLGQTSKPTWSALGDQLVKIQYRTTKNTWVTATTTRTASDGTYRVTKKIGKHQWRAVYGGSSTTGARTSAAVTR
ncbi:hypothetical protein [Kineosporia sp. NBRC 101731]|uniref:hypothetical protein n=1 Tax=Kineosporia sp. NBRC 101731 TaxID=3032199 RepID=UPI0024A0516A|nr:hypothetical protein [Kineosporia sp. NBRC 101731]GLY27184.1 hypothetical protein Kisp02_05490 [Kineosporia sp. NBRC 101731]